MRIGINCGHTVSGQPGCGAVGYIDESVETRNVGYALIDLFRAGGHIVVDCTMIMPARQMKIYSKSADWQTRLICLCRYILTARAVTVQRYLHTTGSGTRRRSRYARGCMSWAS